MTTIIASASPAGATVGAGKGSARLLSRAEVLQLPPVEKWQALASQRLDLEADRDYQHGFLASHELRDCKCPRVEPLSLAKQLASPDAGAVERDDAKNTQCELCLHDAYTAWRLRADKQCALVPQLSSYEVDVLKRSNDGNGLPPRCFGNDAPAAVAAGGPPPPKGSPAAPSATGSTTPTSSPLPIDVRPPGAVQPSPAMADAFSQPTDWAPIPQREDGRLYVRLFMSSGCAADVLPGPIQARTGDLLLIPYNARNLAVRSPCGGLAEVYWGREVKPRVSEIFARNQPLHLQFQPQ